MRSAVLSLEPRGEGEQVLQSAAGDDDVLVQLGEPGVAKGVGELPADLPDGFAFVLAEADFDKQRLLGRDNALELLDLAAHRALLAVELDDEVGPAAPQALAPGAFEGGGEREGIGQLQRGGQETGGQDGVQRAHGGAHGAKPDGEAGAIRGQGQQLQRGLGDNAQQAFGADEQPVQLEAGLVLVGAAARAAAPCRPRGRPPGRARNRG